MLISINIHVSRNLALLDSDKPKMLFFPLTNVKMSTIVCILTFMSRTIFMLSSVEHEKKFYSLGTRSLPTLLLFAIKFFLNTSVMPCF